MINWSFHPQLIPENEVLIRFDGWTDGYDYWCPQDSVELHPPGWCSKHGWDLQTPKGTKVINECVGDFIL